MRKHRSKSPRPSALRRITKREGMVAHCIERPAARRARLIMAMQAACKRAAAPGARGYEMPLKRHFRDSSNFWPTAGSASTTSGRIPFRVRFLSFSQEKLLTAHLVLLTQLIITQPNNNI